MKDDTSILPASPPIPKNESTPSLGVTNTPQLRQDNVFDFGAVHGSRSLADAVEAACAQVGITPKKATVPHDGEWHYCNVDGARKGKGKGDGRVRTFKDGEGAVAYNWHNRDVAVVFVKSDKPLSEAERRARIERSKAERAEAEADRERQYAAGAVEAKAEWDGAKPAAEAAADHQYLVNKKVPPHMLRVNDAGELLVPVLNMTGLQSLQRILPDGRKYFFGGAKAGGGFCPIGLADDDSNDWLGFSEGYATGATGYNGLNFPVIVSFDAGNLPRVVGAFRKRFPTRKFFYLTDDDWALDTGNVGLEAARRCAREFGGVVAIPKFGPERKPGHTDWNDMATLYGADVVKRELDRYIRDADVTTASNTLPLIWAVDAELQINSPYVVKGIIGAGDLVAYYGPPKGGKTFLVTDLGLCVVTGRDWFGHRVKPGLVLYIASEMGPKAMRRVRTWMDQKMGEQEDRNIQFACVPRAVNFMDAAQVERLRATINATIAERGKPVLIIVDTLARSMAGGDENSAEDMGYVIGACDAIRHEFGCAVLLIHHTGKDPTKGARGSSALLGAVDAMVLVLKDEETGERSFTVEASRDGPEGESKPFDLKLIDLGKDDDGDAATTCVAVSVDPAHQSAPKTAVKRTRAPKGTEVALQALKDVLATPAARAIPATSAQPAVRAVAMAQWRDRYYHHTPLIVDTSGAPKAEEKARDNRYRGFQRCVKDLAAGGWIGMAGENVWYTGV